MYHSKLIILDNFKIKGSGHVVIIDLNDYHENFKICVGDTFRYAQKIWEVVECDIFKPADIKYKSRISLVIKEQEKELFCKTISKKELPSIKKIIKPIQTFFTNLIKN
jgi:hypothetical protein